MLQVGRWDCGYSFIWLNIFLIQADDNITFIHIHIKVYES